jgi:hypothetical protein
MVHEVGFLLMDAWRVKYHIFKWKVDNHPPFCQWKWLLHQRSFDKIKTVNALVDLTNPTVRGWMEAPGNEDFVQKPEMAFADLAELAKVIASFMEGLDSDSPSEAVLETQATGMLGATNAAIIQYIDAIISVVDMGFDEEGNFYKTGEIAQIRTTMGIGLAFGAASVLSGPCTVVPGSPTCLTSPNYPSMYSNRQACSLSWQGTVTVSEFNTEGYFDWLKVNGHKYSGGSGPAVGTDLTGAAVTWSSDYSVIRKGWRICTGGSSLLETSSNAEVVLTPTHHSNATGAPYYKTNVDQSPYYNQCNDPEYEPITTEAECKTMNADFVGGTWQHSASHGHWPPGCFRYHGVNGMNVYFNTNTGGTGHSGHVMVCKRKVWCGSVGSLPVDRCPSTDDDRWMRAATALFKGFFLRAHE